MLTANNTFTASYQFTQANITNGAVGLLVLPAEGFNNGATTQILQLSDTQLIGAEDELGDPLPIRPHPSPAGPRQRSDHHHRRGCLQRRRQPAATTPRQPGLLRVPAARSPASREATFCASAAVIAPTATPTSPVPTTTASSSSPRSPLISSHEQNLTRGYTCTSKSWPISKPQPHIGRIARRSAAVPASTASPPAKAAPPSSPPTSPPSPKTSGNCAKPSRWISAFASSHSPPCPTASTPHRASASPGPFAARTPGRASSSCAPVRASFTTASLPPTCLHLSARTA